MDQRLKHLYASGLKLNPRYIRDVLGLDGETAERVSEISGGIHEDEANLVADLVRRVNPAVTVEIGLGYGFSALTICAAAGAAEHKHIVIDPHQSAYWGNGGLRTLEQAGFASRVTLMETFSYAALPELLKRGVVADLVFIDGWHTFDYAFVDFFYADKILRPEGLVVFDDADWPSIRPIVRYAVTNLGYKIAATLPEKRPREPIDTELGIEGSCIGLMKPLVAPAREIFFHRPFL